MRLIRLALIIGACAGLLISASPAVSAFEGMPTMTVSELRDGMTGIGKTVVVGTEIETFNFEIIGILEKGGFNGGPLILVRCWGPAIEKSGGIAGGYSGSPLIIGGKLIGALSAAWYFTKGDIAGVTPIHEMLKTFNYPESPNLTNKGDGGNLLKETPLTKPIAYGGRAFGKVLLAESARELEGRDVSDDTLVLVANKTPLIVGGLSDKYFPLVKDELERRMPYADVIQGPGSGRIPTNLSGPRPEPGAAIGVQLVSGDIDLTAVGTLTYVDGGGRFLAFGHPFMMAGYIEMPFATARIIHTVPSIQRSFKMGQAIELVGRIEQDRITCVAGRFGIEPDMLDIKITVRDEDIDWKDTYDCKAIRDDNMMPFFWLLAPLEAVGRTMDRSGGGLMDVSFKVYADGFEKPISMSNIFYANDASAGWFTISELAAVLDALTTRNIFRDARINSIEMNIDVRDEHRTIDIMRASSIMPVRESEGGEKAEAEEEGEGEDGEMKTPEGNGEKCFEFARLDVPDRALLNLASMSLGRKIIRLNAGDEVLEAVKDYIGTKEEKKEKFYEIPKYYPGEKVEVKVLCQPYREEAFEQVISLEIPADFPPGTYDVYISGGSYYFGGMMPGMNAAMQIGGYSWALPSMAAPKSLEELIEDLTDREPNNKLIISLGPIMDEDPYAYLREGYKPPEPIKSVIPMKGVVYGSFFLPIEILTSEGEEVQDGGAEAPKVKPPKVERGKIEIEFKDIPN